jgi:hypothetical protein
VCVSVCACIGLYETRRPPSSIKFTLNERKPLIFYLLFFFFFYGFVGA